MQMIKRVSLNIIVKALIIHISLMCFSALIADAAIRRAALDSIPGDLPRPKITVSKNTADGNIFAAVPYWGNGTPYLVIYDNKGNPLAYRKTAATCADFKRQDNGLLTYYDYASQKFFGMDSSLNIVDSFWVNNGFTTDEHDIKILPNGNVLLIGNGIRFYDMNQYVQGGDSHASVIVNVVQEIDNKRNVVFEWKAYEHYRLTDVSPAVNLLAPSFVHTQINSIDVDRDNNLILSARNLDEITKIDRRTGEFIWRMGGKNNQFSFVNDSTGFSAQHSVTVLPNGNLLVYDNGLFHKPHFSRAIEYELDQANKTAMMTWSFRNTPDIASVFWGNAQRLKNGNTLIGWGMSGTAATEVSPGGEKVFEMIFPADVFSYRVFRFPIGTPSNITNVPHAGTLPEYRLHQNFPNPFNSATTITYELPATTRVILKIYDFLGREVRVLVDGERGAGEHRAVADLQALSSGVYFYRIVAGNVTRMRSMLYLK
ncbi:MAG: hypothetical protein HW389_1188 [Bacteroidetes bacterium]|nr:hypothetical protein [Bacteroidota bacterium]